MVQQHIKEASVLIVDDETSLRNTFKIFLTREGYGKVTAVGTFKEAVSSVSSHMYDLIICDIVLESHSGIELLKRLRQLGVVCPVVMVTGYPHIETASEAVRLGAFDYLSKPVEKEELLKTARLAIQHYHLEKEKKKAEFARESYRRFLETIFSSVSDGIISVDYDLDIIKMNQAAHTLFLQCTESALYEGGSLKRLRDHRDLYRLVEGAEQVISSEQELADLRLEYTVGQTSRLLSCSISLLDDGRGAPSGLVIILHDITPKEVAGKNRSRFHRFIGASPAMQNVYKMIQNISSVDSSVLITGESGTGKELAAEALHRESSRRNKPLVMVDCSAIPENILESELFGHKKGAFTGADETRKGRILLADGGTLFLDEIGDISAAMQLRLLRFLQEKTFYPVGQDKEVSVDVRVVAATNRDLKEKVKNGSFREDLYYRLLIIDLHLPPLRERRSDITLLANHFTQHFARKMGKNITGISEQTQTLLTSYWWPGNVRQLEHAIERACVLCEGATIATNHLPREIVEEKESGHRQTDEPPAVEPEQQNPVSHYAGQSAPGEQELVQRIAEALRKSGGNKSKAARLLQIDRSTLYRKIRELKIDTDMFSF
jgi:two-component system response regulator HydG